MRITSPVHPLFGEVLQAKSFKRWRGNLFLVVMLPDGSPGTVAVSATDLLGDTVTDALSTVLTVEGVRHLRGLVGALKPARRSTSGPRTRK